MKLRPGERIWTVHEGEIDGLVLLPPVWCPPKSARGVIDRQSIVLKRLVEESIEEYGGLDQLRPIESDFRERLDWRQLDGREEQLRAALLQRSIQRERPWFFGRAVSIPESGNAGGRRAVCA